MLTTCRDCENLEKVQIHGCAIICGCALSGNVVPQNSEKSLDGDWHELTFWRVPLECPLPADKADKSEKPLPIEGWEREKVRVEGR
jgi:hypothetical protein